MYYTVYAFLAIIIIIIIIIIINPPPLPPKQNKTTTTTKTGATLALLWNVYAWFKARKETGGDGPCRGGGDKGLSVLHWFFYNQFEDAQEQAPTQVQWHDAELTVKWHLTDRLLSPMSMYCVLGYLLLEPHWSPTQRSIFARYITAQKQAELY